MADVDGEGGTYINGSRITKYSGWDGGLAMGMIIEIYCILTQMFFRSRFILGGTGGETTREHIKGHTENISAIREGYDFFAAVGASKTI